MLQIIVIILSVAADQLSKMFIIPMLQQLPEPHSTPIIPGVFNFTYVENKGASLGILQDVQGAQVFFIIVTIIVLIAGGVFMVKTRYKQSLFLKICLSLIIGGAIGNFIDRVTTAIAYGIDKAYVRDFLDFSQIHFPWVFNIADACLVVGAILLGVYVIFFYKTKEKNAEGSGEGGKEEGEV